MGKHNQKKATLHEFKIGELNVRISKTRIDIETSSETIKVSYKHSLKARGVTPFAMLGFKFTPYIEGTIDKQGIDKLIQTIMNAASMTVAADYDYIVDIDNAIKALEGRMLTKGLLVTDAEDKEILDDLRIQQQHKEMVAGGGGDGE